jgi:AhpD family alkylhydroperoxidase
MQTRININQVQTANQLLWGLGKYVNECGLERSLLDLILVRASQINRCAFCLDMHIKDARVSGESEQRLYSLSAWRETPFYSERERAALAWTEAVTTLGENGVSDDLYEQVRQHFNEQEIIDLTMAVITINSYNRLNLSLKFTVPGRYKSQRQPVLGNASASN